MGLFRSLLKPSHPAPFINSQSECSKGEIPHKINFVEILNILARHHLVAERSGRLGVLTLEEEGGVKYSSDAIINHLIIF